MSEPLLLAMEDQNLEASWDAMLQVAGGDKIGALKVVRRNPACLIAPAKDIASKTLAEFDIASDALDAFRPVTDALRDVGPGGVAVGAVALGAVALGVLAAKTVGGGKASKADVGPSPTSPVKPGQWNGGSNRSSSAEEVCE